MFAHRLKMVLCGLAISLVSVTFSEEADADAEALKSRIAELESKLAELEKNAQPAIDAAELKKLVEENKEDARERMREDSREYDSDERREIEELYQVANKNWRTVEAKESLEKLVKKYKKANRTGCALLYLGQYSQGQEREDYLRQVVDDFSDCYYGNGCLVGGYGRYLLGLHLIATDRSEEAKEIFDEVRKKFKKATGHRGQRIVDMVDLAETAAADAG